MKRAFRVVIPEGLRFEALGLSREPDGSVAFDRSVVEQICAASRIDPGVFWQNSEDNVATLIVAWYAEHLRNGGAPDPVAEHLGAEVRAEGGHEGLQ